MRVDVYENECQVIWCFVAVKPETSKYFRFIRHFYVAQQCRRYGLIIGLLLKRFTTPSLPPKQYSI